MDFFNQEKQILTTASPNDDNDSKKKVLNMMLTIDNTIDDSEDTSFNQSDVSSSIFDESDSEIDFNQLDSIEDTQSDDINIPDSNNSLFNVDGFMRNIYEMKYETEPDKDKIKWPFKESDLDIKPWQTKYEQKYDELVKTNVFLQKKLSSLYNDIHLRMYILDIIQQNDLPVEDSLDASLCYWVFNQFRENATEEDEKKELFEIENLAFVQNKEKSK